MSNVPDWAYKFDDAIYQLTSYWQSLDPSQRVMHNVVLSNMLNDIDKLLKDSLVIGQCYKVDFSAIYTSDDTHFVVLLRNSVHRANFYDSTSRFPSHINYLPCLIIDPDPDEETFDFIDCPVVALRELTPLEHLSVLPKLNSIMAVDLIKQGIYVHGNR